MIPVSNQIKRVLFLAVLIYVLLSLTTGCGTSGGGGVNPNSNSGYNLTVQADSTLLEGGESTPLSIELRDGNGNFLQGQFVDLTVWNIDDPGLNIGHITPSRVTTDSTEINGVQDYLFFTSADTGTARIRAYYNDVSGNCLDSADVDIMICRTLHFLSLTVSPDTIGIGESAHLYCMFARGTQEDPYHVSGKQIYFESCYSYNQDVLFGSITPAYPATSSGQTDNGLNDEYSFSANEAGVALVKAIYYNGLRDIAATGTSIVTVR